MYVPSITHLLEYTYVCIVLLKANHYINSINTYFAILGRLITAKYIAPEKYHKWFPAAETAVRTIYPSDTR